MFNRRKFIARLGGTALTTLGVGNVAASGDNSPTPYERSLQLRDQAGWSNEKWRSYLTRIGIPHGHVRRTWTVPTRGVGTLGLAKSELTATVTYSYPSYASYDIIDYEWDFNESWDDYGKYPYDSPTLAWNDDHYSPTSARDQWVYYGSHCKDPDVSNSKGPSGVVCAWDDAVDDGDFASYFGCYVDRNWEDFTEHERRVYFDYVHAWSQGEIETVTFSSAGGVSVTFSQTTERWDVEDNATEAQLTDGETLG